MSRSNLVSNRCLRRRGYMFAMMLAVLALMGMMGVVVGRLLLNVKHNSTVQLQQQNKQYLNRVILSLAKQSSDADGDDLTEPPAMVNPSTVPGLTNGGLVPNSTSAGSGVASTDVYGRRLGYCAYHYGATLPNLISSPTTISADSNVVALAVISAGRDGTFNTPCPASSSDAASIAPVGDDQLAAYSQNQMVEFAKAADFADIAVLGKPGSSDRLCRLDRSNKFVCDTPTPSSNSSCSVTQQLSASVASNGVPTFSCKTFAPSATCNTNQLATWNGSAIICKDFAPSGTCTATQVSSWNGSQFVCKDLPKGAKGDTGDTGDTGNCNPVNCVDSVGSHPVSPAPGSTWYNPNTCSNYTCTNGTITLNPGSDGVCNNCVVNNVTHPHLSTWDEGPTICKKASCNDGTVTYGAAITTGVCAPTPGTCNYGGQTYGDGAIWTDTSLCTSYLCNDGITQITTGTGACSGTLPCTDSTGIHNHGTWWYNPSTCTDYTCWNGTAVPWAPNDTSGNPTPGHPNNENGVCDSCIDGTNATRAHGYVWNDTNPAECKIYKCNDGTFDLVGPYTGGSCGGTPPPSGSCTASLPKWENPNPWDVLNSTMITQHSNGTMECPNGQIAVGVVVSGLNSNKSDTGYEDSRIAVICNTPVLSNCGSGATLNIYNAQYSSSSTDMGANSQGAVDCGNDVLVGLKMTQGGNMDTNKISPKCAKLSINGRNLSLGNMNENAELIDQGSQPIGTTICANLEVARGFFVKKDTGNPPNSDKNQIKPKCSTVSW